MMEADLNAGSLVLEFSPILLLSSFLAELSYLKNEGIRLETSLRIPFNLKMLYYAFRFTADISGCVNYFKLLRQGRIWNNIIYNLECYSDEKSQ